MKYRRHKYNVHNTSRKFDSSVVQCIRCGVIRQYVGGIVTYFINDNVYDRKAPECNPEKYKSQKT